MKTSRRGFLGSSRWKRHMPSQEQFKNAREIIERIDMHEEADRIVKKLERQGRQKEKMEQLDIDKFLE